MPAHYTRKQTTVGGERFITPELKEMEAKILGADERAQKLEYQLFPEIARRNACVKSSRSSRPPPRSRCSMCSARWRKRRGYFAIAGPQLNESLRLVIKDGRHPVLDQNLVEEKFVPNDTDLDGEKSAWPSSPGRTWRVNRPISARSR